VVEGELDFKAVSQEQPLTMPVVVVVADLIQADLVVVALARADVEQVLRVLEVEEEAVGVLVLLVGEARV
jgi:hypothetical protein